MKRIPSEVGDILKKYGLEKRDKRWLRLFSIKLELANLFGGKCKKCDEEDLRALCFHHKLGNIGSDEWRHLSRKQRYDHIRAIINRSRPKDIELLCMNCHTKESSNPKLGGRFSDFLADFKLRKMMIGERATPTELPDGLKLIE